MPRGNLFDVLNSRTQVFTNRTKTVKKEKNYSLYIGLILGCLYLPALHAQQIGIPHDDYLRAIGLEEEGVQIKQELLDGLQGQAPHLPGSNFENNAAFFSMVLTLSGITPEIYQQLETEGIDIIHAITAESRPFSEQSLLSDLVLIGTVSGAEKDESYNDGFEISVQVVANEYLKGSAPVDSLIIRQSSEQRNSDMSNRPEADSTYLFLLSSGMYGYQRANHQFRESGEALVTAPNTGKENVFVIYRMYPLINGTLQHTTKDLTTVRKELKNMDELIHHSGL